MQRSIKRHTFKPIKIKKLVGILMGLSCLTVTMMSHQTSKIYGLTIEDKVLQDQRIKYILGNQELYPAKLIELAVKKPETRDFVAAYPFREAQSVAALSQEQIQEDERFPHYLQWDERWGYTAYGNEFLAINGCGPTTLAMVIAGLTNNPEITPDHIATYSKEQGHFSRKGTKWSLFTEGAYDFGIKGEMMAVCSACVTKALKLEKPIIASMKPGNFTSEGHFILITGMTETGELIIQDSDSIERSNQTWPMATILKEAKGMWQFENNNTK